MQKLNTLVDDETQVQHIRAGNHKRAGRGVTKNETSCEFHNKTGNRRHETGG